MRQAGGLGRRRRCRGRRSSGQHRAAVAVAARPRSASPAGRARRGSARRACRRGRRCRSRSRGRRGRGPRGGRRASASGRSAPSTAAAEPRSPSTVWTNELVTSYVVFGFMAACLRVRACRGIALPCVSRYGFPYPCAVRALDRLDELYAIGGGPGANRIGYSPEEDAAHELARGWLEEAGPRGRGRRGREPVRRHGCRVIWTGSHLDTVPQGGKFDGALGVVAAIEAVERAGARDAWSSSATRSAAASGRVRSSRAARCPDAFVELHIEQGPRLAEADAPLGIVTGDRRLRPRRGRRRGRGRPRGDDADGRARRRARQGGRADRCACARRRAAIDGAVADRRPDRGRARRRSTSSRAACASRSTSARPTRSGSTAWSTLTGIDARGRCRPTAMSPAVPDALARGDRGTRAAGRRARLRRGARCGRARARGRAERDALRPQPERRRLALARRALLRGGHRARDRRARRGATRAL